MPLITYYKGVPLITVMRPVGLIIRLLYAQQEMTVSKITLKGHIVVPEMDMANVLEELPRHIELTRAESGCLVFEVTQDIGIFGVFRVYEEFVDRESFESHQSRVRESRWGAVTKNVERHYEITEAVAS